MIINAVPEPVQEMEIPCVVEGKIVVSNSPIMQIAHRSMSVCVVTDLGGKRRQP